MSENNELTQMTRAAFLGAHANISRFQRIMACQISDDPHALGIYFSAEQIPDKPQTPEGEHAFLVNRQDLIDELRYLLWVLDPATEEQILQELRRISGKLEKVEET